MCALSCHLFLLEWSEGVWAVLPFLRLSIPLSLFSLVWSEYFPPRQLLTLLKFLWVALKMKLVIANISRTRVERLTSALLLFCHKRERKKKVRWGAYGTFLLLSEHLERFRESWKKAWLWNLTRPGVSKAHFESRIDHFTFVSRSCAPKSFFPPRFYF